MTEKDWKNIRFMNSLADTWGDKTKMAKNLVTEIDNMRIICGRTIQLTCKAYSIDGHSENSQDYLGNAADIKILGVSLFKMFLIVDTYDFNAIGLYPNSGNPYIHVDVRELKKGDPKVRWIYVHGKYYYGDEYQNEFAASVERKQNA